MSVPGWLLGIDIGGTGSRAAMIRADAVADAGSGAGPAAEAEGTVHGPADAGRSEIRGGVVAVGASGSSVPELALALVAAAAEAWPERMERLAGLAVGASGLASLVEDPARLPDELAAAATSHGAPAGVAAAAAIDAVTAHLGALAGGAGAMVALGTGAIALGSDGRDAWHRVDGWGHLLGDRGGGAWLGLRGLELAMRAHDGVSAEGTALLRAAESRFGPPASWPAQLYTRHDRAAVLASFAPDILALAQRGDPACTGLLRAAGAEAARSAVAALREETPARIALTGGLARAAEPIRHAFVATVLRLRPDAAIVEAAGDPLDGALRLAERAATGRLRPRAPYVWGASSGEPVAATEPAA